jgi:hypothetical protein
MQFNNKITIRIADAYDDYGEPNSHTSHVIKCAILNQVKLNQVEEKKKRNQYDMVIICTARTYSPYSDLFEDSTLEFLYGEKIYEPAKITQISNFSGKPKYYEIGLKQKTKGEIVIEAAV